MSEATKKAREWLKSGSWRPSPEHVIQSRNLVSALLAEVERLEEQLAATEDALHRRMPEVIDSRRCVTRKDTPAHD